jgi:hypothetical protein
MRHVEKRLIPRTPLDHISQSSLSIIDADRRKAIHRLKDISESGLSFYLDQALQISHNISLEYLEKDVKFEVFGRVAWCSQIQNSPFAAGPKNNFLVGVELMSPMLLLALLPKA